MEKWGWMEPKMHVIANTLGGKVVWSLASQFEVAEGLAVAGSFLLVALVIEYCGFYSVFDSPVFSKHLKPRLSYLFAALGVAGTLSYALLVLCNFKKLLDVLDVNGLNVVQYPLRLLGFLGGSALGQSGPTGYGALALLLWGLTIVSLSLAIGFARTMKFFTLPSILFLTVVVFLYDPGQMDIQAINLLSGFTYDGISLLSNWFLLTTSLIFITFIPVHKRLVKK